MKWLATGLAAVCLVTPAAAQTRPLRAVSGRIVDARSKAPLPHARIRTQPSGIVAEADLAGRFALTMPLGDSLLVSALGFRPERLGLTAADSVIGIALEPDPAPLPDLVVTASRRPQRSEETPISIQVVTREDLVASAAASLERAIGEQPGLQVLPSTPAGADLSIRGIGGSRVLVLVDGEPTAGDLLENRDLSRLSTLSADRIEIVKGPLSALYGSQALGGVVNLVTRVPEGPLSFSVDAVAGSQGRKEGRVGAQAAGAFPFRVDGGWREENRVAGTAEGGTALGRVWDLRATGRLAPGGTLTLRGDVSALRERQRWRLTADGFNGFNDNQGISGWVEAGLARGAGGGRARLYAEEYRHRFRQSRGDQPLASDTAPAQRERMVKGSLAWATRLGRHALDLGVDLGHRAIESPGKVDGVVTDGTLEVYGQDTWTAGALLLTPAARASWNSRWGTAVTPSLTAAWDAGARIRLRTGAGRGFRGPSFKELAWNFPNAFAGYAIRGNPDLVPETSWQVFAGATVAAADGLALYAEGFRNQLRNLIELADAGTDPGSGLLLFSPRNVSRARTEGFEAGARWSPAGFLLAADYAYLRARDLESGRPLDRRAAHSGRIRLGWLAERLGGLRVDLTTAYTGNAPVTAADGSASRQGALLAVHSQLRLGLGYGLELAAGVDNLLDSRPENSPGLTGRAVYFRLRGLWTP